MINHKINVFIIILKIQLIFTRRSNHSCYTCIEPLVGFTDHSGSCKYLNTSSSTSLSFIQDCDQNNKNNVSEYECRKVVTSYRSVETQLRRDCVPKGLCSWKDRTKAMINTPVSNCVYTDERAQKLECIYCCDTPLCNRTEKLTCLQKIIIIFLLIFLVFFFFR